MGGIIVMLLIMVYFLGLIQGIVLCAYYALVGEEKRHDKD